VIRWPDKKSEPIKYISVYYSFPERLVERWLERYGLELCLKICQASNNKPELTLRVNTLKINSLELQKILLKLKINFQQGIYLPSTSIIIKDYFDIKNSYLFKEGLFSIQDESSMLAAVFLAPDTGQTIFDMCSGPGGKTTHIAQLMYNKGKIIAFEKNKKRLKMVEEECHRLGIDIVTPVLMDSSKLSNKYLEKADKILLDVPCSGTGVIRKKPDLKWKRFDSYQLKELNQLQEALLTTAASYLKPGGELLYATCSIEKEENDQIISNFLKKNSNFALLDSSQFVQKNGIVKFDTKIKTDIQLLPGYSGDNIDGFYMVKMKKNK
jgi:16S rRNA (cytosine967-C5)-methyltransferase